MIEHLELQRLMSLEIVVYNERFHKVRIQIVLHDLCLVCFDPLPCPPPIAIIVSGLCIHCNQGISLANIVDVHQIPA
jgi:hypothetical protein